MDFPETSAMQVTPTSLLHWLLPRNYTMRNSNRPWWQATAALLLSTSLAGCGTALSRMPYFAGMVEPGIYRGVVFDANNAPGMLLDLPLSLVFDTLMLPFDLYELAIAPSEAGLRILDELHGHSCPDDGYRIHRHDVWFLGVNIRPLDPQDDGAFCVRITSDRDIAALYHWVTGKAHPDLPCEEPAIGSAGFEEQLSHGLESTGMKRRR